MANYSLPSIFAYEALLPYLADAGRVLTGKNRRMTAEAWALRLGYRSPRTVGMVLKGTRSPSHEFLERISKALDHNPREHRYLELLAKRQHSSDESQVIEALNSLKPPKRTSRVLKPNEVRYLCHWYHFVIKQMMGCSDFNPDPRAIAARIGSGVTVAEVMRSLTKMIELGIIEKTDEPRGYRVLSTSVSTTADVPDPVIRLHHEEQMIRARQKLRQVGVEDREFFSLTLAFDPTRTADAKKFIRNFMVEFDQKFTNGKKESVYQCNLQFFPQTEARRNAN